MTYTKNAAVPVFFFLLLIASPLAAQTLLRVATPGALTGALPIYLGAKKGIFAKYGLTVEVIATRNEQMNMQALISDSVKYFDLSLIEGLKSEIR